MTKKQPVGKHAEPGYEPEVNRFFRAAIKTQASDLHLKVGQPPKLRVYGLLKDTTGEVMTAEKMTQFVFDILSAEQKEFFLKNGNLDFAYEISNEGRFRVSIFRQRGLISLAARLINTSIPPLEALHLPPILRRISDGREGLVLVVGPSGCGKSTTIASMIEHINSTHPCHIVTIENPIEYLFEDKKAIVSQREIGTDVQDFEQALNYLAQQDPDIISVGEIRDARTVTAAIRAAETGHLVLGTMYSINATQAIQRLLDLFDQSERNLIRQTLSLTIKAIISQILLPSIKQGVDRIPAVEVLLANPSVKKLIAEGRETNFPSVIQSCREEGMLDLTDSLCELVKNGSVHPRVAYEYAPNAEELKMAIKGIKTRSSGIL